MNLVTDVWMHMISYDMMHNIGDPVYFLGNSVCITFLSGWVAAVTAAAWPPSRQELDHNSGWGWVDL